MILTFLGSGSAFCMDNFQSNALIQTPSGKKMLFDCGGDIRWSLKEQGLSALDIDAIYVSHLHADHIGGLEYMAFLNYFCKTVNTGFRPKLFANSMLIKDLWNQSLRGGLDSIQLKDATLETFFDTVGVPNNASFEFDGCVFKPVQTIHVIADATFVKSFGLKFKDPISGTSIFITSDTQFAPTQLKDFIKGADVVFHDCETSQHQSGVHAHYEDLKTLAPELKKKIWLYHYNTLKDLPDARADGFSGFVSKGQKFEF